jgi:hypothetical protein
MKPHGTLIFEEEQHFNPYLTILLPVAILMLVVAAQIVTIASASRAVDGHPRPDAAWAIALILTLVLPLVVLSGWFVRLVTEVRTGGVFVRIWPFPFKHIRLDGTTSIRSVTYRPLRDYGGWGYRIKLGTGKRALNARGDRGVLIEYAGGRSMLIGSQTPDRLLRAIETLAHQKG